MKAITIWQPWPSLIMLGEKQYETRGWATSHRGLLAIHAAAPHPELWHRMKQNGHLFSALERRQRIGRDLPTSAILGIVELVEVFPTEQIRSELSRQELAFGDFADGRFAWRLKVVEVFKQPKPMRGRQGLWTWEEQ